VLAVTLGVFFVVATNWFHAGPAWQLAVALLCVFILVVLVFDIWVYRPLGNLIHRSRSRLGGNYERSDPFYRDEIKELGYLVGTLIAVFTAAEDKEWVSQDIKEDLERVRALNRQLMDVGELGKEMNAALPYRETVDRVLSRSRTRFSRPTSPRCCSWTPTHAPSRSRARRA
jgi:hypothetical protein